jgi:hypothetical protein
MRLITLLAWLSSLAAASAEETLRHSPEIFALTETAVWSLDPERRTGSVDGAGGEEASRLLDDRHPAASLCRDLKVGGKTGWRLPDLFELAAIEAHGIAPVETGVMVWSSIEYTESKAQAWSFGSSTPVASMPKTAPLSVICLRDAEGTIAHVPSTCMGEVPGDACGDGTVLVGTTPDGRRLFTAGFALPPLTWSAGATEPEAQVFVGATSVEDGIANAAMIVPEDADRLAPGVQFHPASRACASYRGAGRDDWRLPSLGELRMLQGAKSELPFLSGSFWSSTEVSADRAMTLLIASGRETAAVKTGLHRAQCVRS